jgi:PAS domain S-box-containing protein
VDADKPVPGSRQEIMYKAFQSSPLVIGVSTLKEGKYLEVNDAFHKTLGYSREEVIGHTSFELGIWQDAAEREKVLGMLSQNQKIRGTIVHMQTKDRRKVIFSANIEPIEIENQACLLVSLEDITERERTGLALRASEEKYRLLIENASEAVIVIQDGLLQFFNAQTGKLTGYPASEMLLQHFAQFIYPDDLDLVTRNYFLRLKGETLARSYEFRIKTKDNAVRWVEANGATITWEGKPASLSILNDITEKKLAQEQLKHSEELFRLLAENAKDLIFRLRIRPEVQFEYISPSVLAFTGYSAREHYDNPDILQNIRHFADSKTGDGIFLVENPGSPREMLWTRKDGSVLWAEEQINPLYDSSGRLIAIEGIVRDITGRKQFEAALADEATRRRILVDQSRDGIVVLDPQGRVYETNRRFAEMIGYTPEEVLHLHVWDWDDQLPRQRVLEMLATVDEKGDHFETGHRRKDGTVIDVEISSNGAVCAGQKLIFCVCRDITERKRMEETVLHLYEMEKKQRQELQEEARARGLFIDVLAHELRTPLTPILASVSMLRDILGKGQDRTLKRLSENVYVSAQALTGRLEELLEVARYSRGTFKLKTQPTSIYRFVKGVIARFEPTLEKKSQQLLLDIADQLPEIEIDQSRIEQVLINLLSNASKFAPEGNITLEIRAEAGKVYFSVTDKGIGISGEEQSKIFQPYHRVVQDRQKFPGIGLGLAVCKQIVEAHGGKIEVTSQPGEGSTFLFWLPVRT